MSDALEGFVDPDDLDAIMRVRGEAMDVSEALALVTHAARIRFEYACLQNVHEGMLGMEMSADGVLTWRLTEAGTATAERERAERSP